MPIIIHMTTSLQGYGQSIWLDFISRKMIATGQLARLVADEDVVGVTSNPTIFEKKSGARRPSCRRARSTND